MKKTLHHLLGPAGGRPLACKTVAVRVDFNVPLSGGAVDDAVRIDRSIPTLERLSNAGARIVLLSHFGRPGGHVDPALSLAPVADYLSTVCGFPVHFVGKAAGPEVERAIRALKDGDALLIENTRFLPGETSNDGGLGLEWAHWADHFVSDAFGTAHRAHASTDALPRAVQAKGGLAVAGMLMERELRFLGQALTDPDRPFLAVLGGAKISGKIDVIEALLPKTDALLIGGAMANTFFQALGLETGTSLVEPDKVDVARDLLSRAGPRLVLPVDAVVASEIAPDAVTQCVPRTDVAPDQAIGDIGPATRDLFRTRLAEAATVIWNGPMGVFEMPPFAAGTFALAEAAAAASDGGTTVIVGGGDSAAAAEAAGVAGRISHISTGGGATLEFLAGRTLPGVDALSDAGAS